MEVLIRELFFQEFRHRLNKYGRGKFRRFLKRAPLVQLSFTSVVFLIFSFVFLRAEKLLGENEIVSASLVSALLVFVVVISSFLALEFLYSLSRTRALYPLLILPTNVEFLPLKAWLKYYIPPLVFLLLPFFLKMSRYHWMALIVSILWFIISTAMGWGFGSLIAVFSLRMKKTGILRDFLSLVVRSVFILFLTLFIFYGVVFPEVFKNLLHFGKLPIYLFPIVQAVTLIMSFHGVLQWKIIMGYAIFSFLILLSGNRLVMFHLIEEKQISKIEKSFEAKLLPKMFSMIAKDAKLALRRSSSLFILLMPFIFLVPLIFLRDDRLVTWVLIIGSFAAITSLNVQILLMEEYKNGWFLFSLPIEWKEFRNAKALTSLILFVPVLLVSVIVAGSNMIFLFTFGALTNLLMAKVIALWLTRNMENEYTLMPAYLTIGDTLVIFGLAFLLVNFPASLFYLLHGYLRIFAEVIFLVLEGILMVILYKEA